MTYTLPFSMSPPEARGTYPLAHVASCQLDLVFRYLKLSSKICTTITYVHEYEAIFDRATYAPLLGKNAPASDPGASSLCRTSWIVPRFLVPVTNTLIGTDSF